MSEESVPLSVYANRVRELSRLRKSYDDICEALAESESVQHKLQSKWDALVTELEATKAVIEDMQQRIEFLQTYVSDYERAEEAETAVKVMARLLSNATIEALG